MLNVKDFANFCQLWRVIAPQDFVSKFI